MSTFEIYKDKSGQFRWRLKASKRQDHRRLRGGLCGEVGLPAVGFDLIKSDAA